MAFSPPLVISIPDVGAWVIFLGYMAALSRPLVLSVHEASAGHKHSQHQWALHSTQRAWYFVLFCFFCVFLQARSIWCNYSYFNDTWDAKQWKHINNKYAALKGIFAQISLYMHPAGRRPRRQAGRCLAGEEEVLAEGKNLKCWTYFQSLTHSCITWHEPFLIGRKKCL